MFHTGIARKAFRLAGPRLGQMSCCNDNGTVKCYDMSNCTLTWISSAAPAGEPPCPICAPGAPAPAAAPVAAPAPAPLPVFQAPAPAPAPVFQAQAPAPIPAPQPQLAPIQVTFQPAQIFAPVSAAQPQVAAPGAPWAVAGGIVPAPGFILPPGSILPGGAVFPDGRTLAPLTVGAAGLFLPAGTRLPGGVIFPGEIEGEATDFEEALGGIGLLALAAGAAYLVT